MDFVYPDRNVANATMVPQGTDRSVFAEFYDKPIMNEFASEQEGRPIYDTKIFIKEVYPGDRTKTRDTFAKLKKDGPTDSIPTDIERFPAQWNAFQKQQTQVQSGMPLEQWPPLTKARVMELKASSIHTVEQLAALSDQNGPNFGLGWRKERDLALNWLTQAKDGSSITRLTAENERQKADIEMLKNQVAALAAGRPIESISVPKKRGPKPRLIPTEGV